MAGARSSPSGKIAAKLLRGTNLYVDGNNRLLPVTRPRRFYDWDYFWSGGVASGLIGRMGWNLLGLGTPALARVNSTFINSAKILLSTSNASGDRSVLALGDTEARQCSSPNDMFATQWLWRMNNSLANKRAFFGWSSNFATAPQATTNCFGLFYDSALSPNYQVISRIGGVGNPVDLGIVVPVNTGQIFTLLQPTAGNFQFYMASVGDLNSALIASIANPSFNSNHGWRLETLTTAVANLEIGYWGVTTQEIGGLYSLDNVFGDA